MRSTPLVAVWLVLVTARVAADSAQAAEAAWADEEQMRSAVESFNYALGTQTIGVRYGFTGKTRLVETAEAIHAMGSNVLKLSMERKYCGEAYSLPKRADVTSLATLAANEPSFRHVLAMPFRYYLIWVYGFTSGWWVDGFSADEREKEYAEIYELAAYLLETFNGSGKAFYLGHWEGDWHLFDNYDTSRDPPAGRAADMIAWLNTRQKAVDDARREVPHEGVEIYHYTEVNKVVMALEGRKCVTNSVLPHTRVDYVSYSAYDALRGDERGTRETLRKCLDHIESRLPAKKGIAGKRVFIGEYGFPLVKTKTPEEQDRRSRWVMRAGLEWGCPFVLYWELYCNENKLPGGKHRGFWMIDDEGRKQPVYRTHERFYARTKRHVGEFLREHGRLPTREEYGRHAVGFLD